MTRRLPAPWTVHSNDACYWVEAANGTKLAYVYFVTQNGGNLDRLTRDEARRVAAGIARLPGLLSRPIADPG